MSILLEKLADTCHELLYKNEKFHSYLERRQLTEQTIQEFNLGAFPKDFRVLFNKLHPEELRKEGIIWNAIEGPFKNKRAYYPIVIPIRDIRGKTIAIGCRTLIGENKRKEMGLPKYLNSSYQKSAYLYGLDKAVEAIRENNKVYIVEGYFDVISCHQAGIKNVVATCGTAFGLHQLIILARYTENICLLYDNDQPGYISARRALQLVENHPIISANLECRFTPKGYKDIDEYLCQSGDLKFFDR